MSRLAATALVLLSSSAALAEPFDATPPTRVRPAPGPPPLALPRPGIRVQPAPDASQAPWNAPAPPRTTGSDAERFEHVLKAAEHLEKAGRTEQAAALRRSVDLEKSLREKRGQLKRLQREIVELERLREQATGEPGPAIDVRFAPDPNATEDAASDDATRKTIQVEMSWLEIGHESETPRRTAWGLNAIIRAAHSRGKPVEEPTAKRTLLKPAVTELDAAGAKAIRDLLVAHAGAKVVAEPTLVTRERQEARILCGGEMPIPIPQSDGTTEIEYREFGTSAKVVPTFDDEGRIQLDLDLEVSTRDFENAVEIEGMTVPALNTQRCATRVAIEPGRAAFIVVPSKQVTRIVTVRPSRVKSANE